MVGMSMNELSTYSWTFDEDVLRYAEAGYEAIGVWRSKLTDFGEDKGVELLREQQLKVSNLFWAGGFTGSDGRRYRESIEDAIEAIYLAEELAAECLVIYTGSRAGPHLQSCPPDESQCAVGADSSRRNLWRHAGRRAGVQSVRWRMDLSA